MRSSQIDALRPSETAPLALRREEPSEVMKIVLKELLGCEPGEAEHVIRHLKLHESRIVLPVIKSRFPGILWFDRKRPHRRLPRGRDVSAVAAVLVAYGGESVPYLLDLLEAPNPDTRYYAALVAEDLAHASTIPYLHQLLFDEATELRDIGAFALGAFRGQSELGNTLISLRECVQDSGRDSESRRFAIEALIRMRDEESVLCLIDELDGANEQVAKFCHRALRTLTARDFGASARGWDGWLRTHRESPRQEWLLDALIDRKASVRAVAYQELCYLSGLNFGDAPAARKDCRQLRVEFEGFFRQQLNSTGRALE